MRLNKFLAQSGLGSRRAVEQLILDGIVKVNGKPVTELATQVDLEHDTVEVQGRTVRPVRKLEYIALNKPRGYDVTRGGRHHHRRAWDLLPEGTHPSVQSVGRLDRDSMGLLLFTNDGELAFRLTHPSYGCQKTYEVAVEGNVAPETAQQLMNGVELEDGLARAVLAVKMPSTEEGISRLKVIMEEGRNRIVRRMFEALRYPVVALNRTAIGGLTLGIIPRGKTRPLTSREVMVLRKSVGLGAVTSEHRPAQSSPSGASSKPRGKASPRSRGDASPRSRGDSSPRQPGHSSKPPRRAPRGGGR